jgi:dihydrofolate reductase
MGKTARGDRKSRGSAREASGRRVRYQVAASLDGFIAGPKDEADWIIMDPEIDFQALFDQFDTFLVGRRTFEAMATYDSAFVPKARTIVFSRTLAQSDYPKTTIVSDDEIDETIAALRAEPGKDIWLFGGGSLFASLLDRGLVDTVEVAIVPVLLGGGIPLLPSPAKRTKLKLTGHRVYEKSGIVLLEYAVA